LKRRNIPSGSHELMSIVRVAGDEYKTPQPPLNFLDLRASVSVRTPEAQKKS
jgi:hypothetical protein